MELDNLIFEFKLWLNENHWNIQLNLISFKLKQNGIPGVGGGSTLQLTTAASSGITPIVNSQTSCATLLERCCPTNGWVETKYDTKLIHFYINFY